MVDFAKTLGVGQSPRWRRFAAGERNASCIVGAIIQHDHWVLSDAQGQTVGVVYNEAGVWMCKAVGPNRFGATIALHGEILATAVRECESILRDLGWIILDHVKHAQCITIDRSTL